MVPYKMVPYLSLLLLGLACPALGKVIKYELNVTYGFAAPDCVNKQVININGDYPGPTLYGVEGDIMSVTVRNFMSADGLSIHWHGIDQFGTNFADGTAFVTQCPIDPLDFIVQTFTLDKAGTFMYHGHLSDQVGEGLYGKLIVLESPKGRLPYKYDGDLSVIINDWYHRSMREQIAGLDNIPFIWVGEPQSLLLNGRGEYNCSLVPYIPNPITGDAKVCNATIPDCNPPETFIVEQGKTYRFRISSIASLSSLNLVVDQHQLTVIEADAYTVKPFVIGQEGLDVYSGQTYDVLFTADQPIGNYWIRTAVFGRKPSTPFGKAILRYVGANETLPDAPLPAIRPWNDTAPSIAQALRYRGLMKGVSKFGQVPPVPLFPNETQGSPVLPKTELSPTVLVNSQQKVGGRIRWALNNISFEAPPVPYALGIGTPQAYLYEPDPQTTPFTPWDYSAPPPTDAFYGSGYFNFAYGSVVDIILQNTNTLTPGNSEYHPWHMHGHQFWVLGYANGTFQESDHQYFNLVDPPYRNTVTIFPFGWVAIRVRLNNPGAWMFHCHIAFHLHMGMAIVFVDGYTLPVPPNTQRCGILYKPGFP